MKERRKITVELLDKMLSADADEGKDADFDELMEVLWGDERFEGVFRDVLILARVAVDHLNVVIVQTSKGRVGEVANEDSGQVQVPK